LGFICCNQENSNVFISKGIIIGPDIRMCACCGGWYIQIDSTTYEFDTLPVNSDIDLQKETFPLFVKLDWQLSDKGGCPNNRITVQRIIKE
jgi:hypothetical protein